MQEESALIFGNNADGSNGTLYHSQNEISNQTMIATYLNNLFQSCGYSNTVDDQGSETAPPYFTSALYYADNSPGIATVYFDHGIGMPNYDSQPDLDQIQNWVNYPDEFHYMLDGTTATWGSPLGDFFDYQIYDLTSNSNYYFCWISTCESADLTNPCDMTKNGVNCGFTGTYGANDVQGNPATNPEAGSSYPVGMPYAWTHGASMSTNGYTSPDTGAYCYIGFPSGSAPLAQTSPALNPNYPNVFYGEFVSNFFYATLSLHDKVNQALDYASGMCWSGETFQNTVLYDGFAAFWPTYNGDTPDQSNTYGDCTMAVYGNGNMYLYTGSPDYVSTPTISGPTSGDGPGTYYFSASATDPCGYGLTCWYNYGDGSGWTTQSYHTYENDGVYTVTAYAQSSTGLSSQSSTTTIAIGPTYQTEVDVYLTYNGVNGYYYGTYYINEPAGWNYLNFNGLVEAYDYYDSSYHTTNPDWYDLGTGTTIEICCWA